jgi:hypothetical protein
MDHQDIFSRIESIAEDSYTISTLENLLVKEMVSSLDNALNISNNEIIGTSISPGAITKKGLKSFYSSKQYQDSLLAVLQKVEKIGVDKVGIYANDGLNVAKTALNKQQGQAIDYILDAMNESGLNARFNQPMRNLIYENVKKGSSKRALEESLRKYIKSNPEKASDINRYFKNIVENGADAYSSVVDQKIAEKYSDSITGYRVIGSLINNSSPQCRYAVNTLNRFVTKENFESMVKIGLKHGIYSKIEFSNLAINKNHIGCRHQFIPIVGKTE